MKRMRQWINTGTAVGLGLLLTTGALSPQEPVVWPDACPEGLEEGSIGISGLDCVGECSLMIWGDGSERSWSFSTEPRILGVEYGSPAHGVLQEGDFLVAIDGVLITTKEGGNRYANLEPGEQVRVRYRREGRVREARMEVRSRCREPRRAPSVGRRVPVPATPDEPEPARGIVVAPRVRVAPERRGVAVAEEVEGVSAIAGTAARGILTGPSPTGKLGVGFQCTDCGTRTNEETGEDVWFFSGSLEVTAVHAGGAADKAGIQRGDLIKAIDGHGMASEEGGVAFTRLEPGESVRLTVVKRNGSEVEVDLVPETAAAVGVGRGREPRAGVERRETVGVRARALPSARRAESARPERPAIPDRVDVPEPTPYMEAPEGMPLRYSGTVNGVEVEVRGDPVSVSEVRGMRTLYINADGLWIRITVPGRTAAAGGTLEGLPSRIRR